jgi:hypothetical protein
MPTGYTAAVEDGTITELEPFALRCARAFGALISMRDDAMDAPLPDEIKPFSSYYQQEAMRLADELGALEAMSLEECALAQDTAIAAAKKSSEEYVAELAQRNARHSAMAEKVRAWSPPAELGGLKAFMLEQLTISMSGPYVPEVPNPLPCGEWKASRMAELHERLERARKHLADEATRLREANEWLALLRASL